MGNINNQAAESQMQEIIQKIGNQQDGYLKLISNHLIDIARDNEDLRSVLLSGDKDLKGCYSYISNKAKSQAKNGCACIEDRVVYEWSEEYWYPSSEMAKQSSHREVKAPVLEKSQEKVVKINPHLPGIDKKKAKKKDECISIPGQMNLLQFVGGAE